ncbi:hypothetical protein AAHA92_17301 [Salvia divinorum]|uniref:Uncharacterized protein n=1 Tax=Salvia divinorum TaxID=28513 RepID=A0ABD1GYV5_SALDI
MGRRIIKSKADISLKFDPIENKQVRRKQTTTQVHKSPKEKNYCISIPSKPVPTLLRSAEWATELRR